jgi:hypothetical protein
MTGRHAPHYVLQSTPAATHRIDSVASVVLAESLIRSLVQPVELGERVAARGHRHRSAAAGRDGGSCCRRLAMEERVALGEGRLLLLLLLHGDRSRKQPSQSVDAAGSEPWALHAHVQRQDVAQTKTLQSSSKSICDKPPLLS